MLFVDELSRDRNLDDRVQRQGVHAPGRQEGLRREIAAQDLQEDGNTGRDKGRAVDEELRPVLSQQVSYTAYCIRSLYRIRVRPGWRGDLRRRGSGSS